MKITIETEPKEIADLVREIQDRPGEEFVPRDRDGIRDSYGSTPTDRQTASHEQVFQPCIGPSYHSNQET